MQAAASSPEASPERALYDPAVVGDRNLRVLASVTVPVLRVRSKDNGQLRGWLAMANANENSADSSTIAGKAIPGAAAEAKRGRVESKAPVTVAAETVTANRRRALGQVFVEATLRPVFSKAELERMKEESFQIMRDVEDVGVHS